MEALDKYQSLLISYAREITGEMESAKDAVQETFIRLSRQKSRIRAMVEHVFGFMENSMNASSSGV